MIATAPKPPRTTPADIQYPTSDGKPMAETGIHVESIMLLRESLRTFYAGRTDVLVTNDQFMYWEKGNAKKRLAPDIMIVPGVSGEPVDRYCVWEHGVLPAAVFEFSSKKTIRIDLTKKLKAYRKIGIAEYFLYDPQELALDPPLLGYRLNGKKYARLRPAADGAVDSLLGFKLKPEGIMLRMIDTASGQPIPTGFEAAEAARQKAEAERVRAEDERQKAERAKAEAEAEKARADSLEAKVARLQALLQQHNIPGGNGTPSGDSQ